MIAPDNLMKIYTMLVKAKNPCDVFGSPLVLEQVVEQYKKMVLIVHPDHNRDMLPLAEEATKILNAYYKEAEILCTKQVYKDAVIIAPKPSGVVVKPKSMTDKVIDFFNDPRVIKTNKFLSHWNDRLVAREEANNGSIFGGRMFAGSEQEPKREPKHKSKREEEDEPTTIIILKSPKRKHKDHRDNDDRGYRGDRL
jgi:hypothetical protein